MHTRDPALAFSLVCALARTLHARSCLRALVCVHTHSRRDRNTHSRACLSRLRRRASRTGPTRAPIPTHRKRARLFGRCVCVCVAANRTHNTHATAASSHVLTLVTHTQQESVRVYAHVRVYAGANRTHRYTQLRGLVARPNAHREMTTTHTPHHHTQASTWTWSAAEGCWRRDPRTRCH